MPLHFAHEITNRNVSPSWKLPLPFWAARPIDFWVGVSHNCAPCPCGSVVEHSLGKGEVGSSILPMGTIRPASLWQGEC